MIESLTLYNYKAFGKATIPIRPITLLLGANNVGKSSVIQMLMLLHQTAEERTCSYSSAVKIYGNYVNVGDFKNLFNNKVTSSPLIFSIEIDSPEIEDRIRNIKRIFVENFRRVIFSISFSEADLQNTNDFENRVQFHMYIEKFISTLKKLTNEENNLLSFLQMRLNMPIDLTNDNVIDEIMRCYDFVDKISEVASPHYKITYQLEDEDKHLKIGKLSVEMGGKYNLFEVVNKTERNIKISSYFPLKYEDIDFFIKTVNFNNTIFDLFSASMDEIEDTTLVGIFMYNIVKSITSLLKNDFRGEKINYCSPLRAHPKRYYMLDKAKMTISLDTLDGDAIAEVMKENVQVKQSVNEWFKKFDLNIDVQEFKEVIHHMNVTQNGLTLDITDVGFGISQILPIIIQGFLSEENSITIIEQPEIHLHPKMQADLGDLFIDIVTTDDKKLIIETHSEYMLRRIRRRISEGRLKSSDIAICLFHAKTKESAAWIENLEIGERGSFKWPEEYYGGDLYDDTLEFLKNQS